MNGERPTTGATGSSDRVEPVGARNALLLVATGCGGIAVAAGIWTTGLPLPWLVAATVVAVLGLLVTWHRRGRWGSGAVLAGCLVLHLTGASVPLAAVCGLLVLVHVTMVDLAADSHGAAGREVGAALVRLAPGLLLGAAAVPVIVGSVWWGSRLASMPLAVTAPMALLVALLLALGMATRRPFWSRLRPGKALSALTKRYLARSSAGG